GCMSGMNRRRRSWSPTRTASSAAPRACSALTTTSNGIPREAALGCPTNMAEPAPVPVPKHYTPEEITKLKERVEAVLDKIRPAIQMDGGDADLIDLTPEGVAVVQLTGHCETCSLSPITMKLGVERMIGEEVPEIVAVESI